MNRQNIYIKILEKNIIISNNEIITLKFVNNFDFISIILDKLFNSSLNTAGEYNDNILLYTILKIPIFAIIIYIQIINSNILIIIYLEHN
jgi:hypothetical protein